MVALGALRDLEKKLLPLINSVLVAVGQPALEKLDL
jgi:putative ATP-dependent endonuclease of OLD family